MNKASSQWPCFQKANQYLSVRLLALLLLHSAVKYICLLVQHCSHPICTPQLLQSVMPPPSSASKMKKWGMKVLNSIQFVKALNDYTNQDIRKAIPIYIVLFQRKRKSPENNLFKGLFHWSTAFSLIWVPLLWTLIRDVLKVWHFC